MCCRIESLSTIYTVELSNLIPFWSVLTSALTVMNSGIARISSSKIAEIRRSPGTLRTFSRDWIHRHFEEQSLFFVPSLWSLLYDFLFPVFRWTLNISLYEKNSRNSKISSLDPNVQGSIKWRRENRTAGLKRGDFGLQNYNLLTKKISLFDHRTKRLFYFTLELIFTRIIRLEKSNQFTREVHWNRSE